MSHKLTNEELKALIDGYTETALLNSELAEEGIEADNDALRYCEEYLIGKCE